ncbi:MAG: Fic family protein [Coprobacillus sp.]|nr:Fic family protein [Coprobacillus sp.]
MKTDELLNEKALLTNELKSIPYKGTIEIKHLSSGDYLYVRKREIGRISSTYVGPYSDNAYKVLLNQTSRAKEINKRLKAINKELTALGYNSNELPNDVLINIDFAKRSLPNVIYNQGVLEGVSATFADTETIINNGVINGVNASDTQKILNLKHAWESVLDKDVLRCKTDFNLLCYISRIINENFYDTADRLRVVPVSISGTSYVPPFPVEADIKDKLNLLDSDNADYFDNAIEMCLYIMKGQFFIDGNKRTAIIFANHYLIKHGAGLLTIASEDVERFRTLLVEYYEGKEENIKKFMRGRCTKAIK